ncbi:MAG: serine/threonine protein kinase [Bacteroides sp. SM23_62_1]|nr:MAG: serine/threonine protein kinase [Bacteroides sp. SM23_62_1]
MKREINIPSKIENLREVEKLIDEVTNECKLSSEKYGNVFIATLEAANNAILHGNKLDENKDVNIKFSWSEKELNLTIIDQGKGFDYKNIPDPTAPENVEKVNGRGIFLMVKLADKIVFNKKGRVVNLTFNL